MYPFSCVLLLCVSSALQYALVAGLRISPFVVKRTPPQYASFSDVRRRNRALSVRSASTDVIPGIGDDGCSLPSPSGLNNLPESSQAAIFFAIFTALGLSTFALNGLFEVAADNFPLLEYWKSTWPIIGAIYTAAGVSHFTVKKDFMNIMPKTGAWGIWYLPGSKEFHVIWTGIIEILAGLGLCIGALADISDLKASSALVLLVLTVLVTPANIYMYTHGAKLPMIGPEVPITFHLIRGIFQVILFFIFYQLSQPILSSILS